MKFPQVLSILLVATGGFAIADDVPSDFRSNGITAHRGNSGELPENTMPAFESGIEIGADWIELDIWRTQDGKLVVIHDESTERVGDKNLIVPDSTYEELSRADVATDFRRRTNQSLEELPVLRIPLLEDVLRIVMQQNRTRVSIQPKMDCIAETIELVKRLKADRWVGFNDGNLQLMMEVKRLAPEIPVFWDRGAETNVDDDIRIANRHGFESLIFQHSGISLEKIQKVKAAGLEVGAWTVNEPALIDRLFEMGIQRLYTDHPRTALAAHIKRKPLSVACEGAYPHHLQGVCTDETSIFWSFTTTLVKTDMEGKVLKKIPVANHHGDLCFRDGKLYVAVNLGKFNHPDGNADSWVYVYDAESLTELARHDTQEVFHGAGGIGYRDEHFFVVGGLPAAIEENYVYEYDRDFQFVKKHIIESGHTLLGIQTATFAHGRWWFGCYGDPKTLLVTDAEFQMKGRHEIDCSLGIEGMTGGRLLVGRGRCTKDQGCTGSVRTAIPDAKNGFRPYSD